MNKLLFAFFLLISACFSPAKADDVFWVRLGPYFTYRDEVLTCGDKTGLGADFYFMARLNDADQVTWAELRTTNLPFPTRQIVFTQDEISQIKVEKELLGDYSLKTLPMSGRITAWIIFNFDWGGLNCSPRTALSTMTPQPVVMSFFRKESNRFFAPTVKVTGLKVDGRPYEAKIGFWQSLLMNP